MASRKQLMEISYHYDDDTGMYRVGEIDFGITPELNKYIKRYEDKGVDEILSTLGHLAWEVKNCYYEINREKQKLEYRDETNININEKKVHSIIENKRES